MKEHKKKLGGGGDSGPSNGNCLRPSAVDGVKNKDAAAVCFKSLSAESSAN